MAIRLSTYFNLKEPHLTVFFLAAMFAIFVTGSKTLVGGFWSLYFGLWSGGLCEWLAASASFLASSVFAGPKFPAGWDSAGP